MTTKLDASGKETRVMKYDSEGRLSEVDGSTFVYDFSSRLIKATLPNGDVTIYQLSPMRSTFLRVERRKYHAVSDESGDIITQYDYDPYGQVRIIKGADVSRYKFSGKEKFGDLYYFGARFYDPEVRHSAVSARRPYPGRTMIKIGEYSLELERDRRYRVRRQEFLMLRCLRLFRQSRWRNRREWGKDRGHVCPQDDHPDGHTDSPGQWAQRVGDGHGNAIYGRPLGEGVAQSAATGLGKVLLPLVCFLLN
ncbi:hypothetical protein IMY05_C4904000500 [Salix suchowensis]|nr:hypothetical protein IMY05_C4904000500 [Salix suchowensis]